MTNPNWRSPLHDCDAAECLQDEHMPDPVAGPVDREEEFLAFLEEANEEPTGEWGTPRILTFTVPEALPAGGEVLASILASGEVVLAVRPRADPAWAWSPPISPTHDSATPRGVRS